MKANGKKEETIINNEIMMKYITCKFLSKKNIK